MGGGCQEIGATNKMHMLRNIKKNIDNATKDTEMSTNESALIYHTCYT